MATEKDPLVGRKIVAARHMTPAEAKAQAWYQAAPVLELDDGTILFPSRDDEGNGAGALFGVDKKGFFQISSRPLKRG